MISLRQFIFISATAATTSGLVGGARLISRLQTELATSQQQAVRLARQSAQLLAERDAAIHASELAQYQLAAQSVLPTATTATRDEATEASVQSWLERVHRIRALLAENPDQQIPELTLLTDADWLDFSRRALLFTDQYSRHNVVESTFASLRVAAKQKFAILLAPALKKFIAEHHGLLPGNLGELAASFSRPVESTILQRYELLRTGSVADLPPTTPVIAEKSLVDDLRDSGFQITAGGSWHWTQSAETMNFCVSQATRAFTAAHPGQTPTDPAQLVPYLDGWDDIDLPTLQKFWASPLRKKTP